MEPSLQILENIVLLALLGIGYYFVEVIKPNLSKTAHAAGHGFTFGLIAFLVTATPVPLEGGATVDARAAPVILAGYVAGPVAAVIAAALGGLARSLVGGTFAFSGVTVHFVYAALGVVLWAYRREHSVDFLKPSFILLVCLLSCIGAAAMFFLIQPPERARTWFQEDLPIIFFANSAGVVFACIMLGLAQHMLRKSQEMIEVSNTLQLAKKAGNFGIWDFDIPTGVLSWDDRSKELHGITQKAFSGSFDDWANSVHPEDLESTQNAFFAAMKNSDIFDTEYRVVHGDGTQRVIKGDAILLRDSAGKATRVVGTNLDLTEIRAAEEKLREAQLVAIQAQKFDTIGQLTGGVAHDFNNLLAVIMGNIELIEDQLRRPEPDADELQALIDASLEATRRGADLTRNMLAYARKARLVPVPIDLNEVVGQTEAWIRRTIPSKIEIKTNLQAGLWVTCADKTSLQSALVNLLLNARDAFEGSGTVTIETANVEIGDTFQNESGADIAPGRYVMLSVSDDGSGIDPSMVDKVFDPFFTTKGVGEGSGLGLSMVQGFVQQSGGTIRVHSKLGAGTSFELYFPATERADGFQASPKPTRSEDSQREHAPHRILLVEDREEVLLILSKTLRAAGYTVVTAKSGDEGLRLFTEDARFDLVITDVVMPGELQGPSMAREIRRICPDIGFIFLSGYASEGTVDCEGLQSKDTRLMKPVSRDVLLDVVHNCLEDGARA